MNDFILIAREIIKKNNLSQRDLSSLSGLSLGKVNKLIKESIEKGLLYRKEETLYISKTGKEELEKHKVFLLRVLAPDLYLLLLKPLKVC